MIRTLRRLAAIVCAASVSACSTVGVDFSDWAAGYGKAVEKTQNENLLLNMVRAAYNQPLYFTTIPVVRGNGQLTANAGIVANYLQSVPAGQSTGSVSPSVGLAVTSGFGFDMASLDNAEFVTGLLTPISPATVHFYVVQGVPRELLFHLFIDRIEIVGKTSTTTYVNDPTNKDYPDFVKALRAFLDGGLTTESGVATVPYGPPLNAQAVSQGLPAIMQGAAAGLQLMPVPGASGTEYQLVKFEKTARFCFMRNAYSEKVVRPDAFCGAKAKQGDNGTQGNSFDYQGSSLSLVVRSTRDVFNYLGNQIYMQAQNASAPTLMLTTAESKDYNYLNHGDQLLVVKKNQPQPNDMVRVEYRGDTYSVPTGAEGNSALVFTLMAQIVTLSKAVNLIPASTPVLVR